MISKLDYIKKTNLKVVIYINKLIENVGDKFNGIDVDEYINEMRGGNERYSVK